jgi:hypothetical protein
LLKWQSQVNPPSGSGLFSPMLDAESCRLISPAGERRRRATT